jgi:DNA ligase-associated metallophosphoesterase
MQAIGTPKKISLLDQTLHLFAERAVLWEEEQLLIVADPHFGKPQIFRDQGIPLPAGTTADDLQRLSLLLKRCNPSRILFLGDLIHGCIDNSQNFDARIRRWRRHHDQTQVFLVTGNHDRCAGQRLPPFQIDRIDAKLALGPFVFSHEPDDDPSLYGIAGHVHPAVTVRGKGRQKETLACFCFGPQGALLPSFGSFTGSQVIRPTPQDDVFVIAGNEVIAIPQAPRR